MKYIRPASLTWWAGLFALSVGIAAMALPDTPQLSQLGALVGILAGGGDTSPAGLIALGLGLIGLRERLEQAMTAPPPIDTKE
jgi:drug/metabolite transporter (DMT)-like permease